MTATANGEIWIVGATNGTFDDTSQPSQGAADAFIAHFDRQGTNPVIKQFGTSGEDQALGVSIDSTGDVWIVGFTSGDLEGSNNGGRDAFLRRISSTNAVVNTYQFGSDGDDIATAVATDAKGNVWIAGTTSGSFGAQNQGNLDGFLRKHPKNGSAPITTQFGTTSLDEVSDVQVDAEGNVWLVGWTFGTLDEQQPNQGSSDAFVRKYPLDGSPAITFQIGTETTDRLNAAAVDGMGNLWAVGETGGALQGSSNHGKTDAFVIRLSAESSVLQIVQFGTEQDDMATAARIDSQQFLWVGGRTVGALHSANSGQADTFVARFNRIDVAPTFTLQFGSSSYDNPGALAIDASDNVWVAGNTGGSLGGPHHGDSDAYVRQVATDR